MALGLVFDTVRAMGKSLAAARRAAGAIFGHGAVQAMSFFWLNSMASLG